MRAADGLIDIDFAVASGAQPAPRAKLILHRSVQRRGIIGRRGSRGVQVRREWIAGGAGSERVVKREL